METRYVPSMVLLSIGGAVAMGVGMLAFEMDGHEATKYLRDRDSKKPIIALTAHAMKEARKHCLENGFNDHLTKPIDRDILIETLAGYRST